MATHGKVLGKASVGIVLVPVFSVLVRTGTYQYMYRYVPVPDIFFD